MTTTSNEELVNQILEGDSDDERPSIQPGNTTYVESVSEGNNRAFIRGFPSEYKSGDQTITVNEDIIYEFFAERGIKAIDEININPKRDASRTILVTIKFSNPEALSEAIKDSGAYFEGFQIDVKVDKPRRTEGSYGYGGNRRGDFRSDAPRSHVPSMGTFGRSGFGQDIKSSMINDAGYSGRNPDGVRRSAFGEYVQPYRTQQEQSGPSTFSRSTKPATTTPSTSNADPSAPRKQREDPFGGAKAADTASLYSTGEKAGYSKFSFGDLRDPSRKVAQPQPAPEPTQPAPSSGAARQPRAEPKPKAAPQKTYNEKVKEDEDGWRQGSYSEKPAQGKPFVWGQKRMGEAPKSQGKDKK